MGVDVYWESHLKEDKDSQPEFEGWKFAWHSSANKDLWQIVWCKAKKVRNADGSVTGEVRHSATFFKSLNPNLHNQERIYFVTKKDENAKWHGLPELREGSIGGRITNKHSRGFPVIMSKHSVGIASAIFLCFGCLV